MSDDVKALVERLQQLRDKFAMMYDDYDDMDRVAAALTAQAEEIARLLVVLNKRVSARRPLCRWCNGQRALPPFGECDCEERHYNPAIGCTTLRSGNDR